MFWYIVILGLMLVPMTFAIIGAQKQINTNKLVLFYSAAILLPFMALRAPSVGADTKQYIYGFTQINNAIFRDLFEISVYGVGGGYELNFEYGYRLFNKFVGFFSTSEQAIIIANSIVIFALLVLLIKRQSAYPFLSIWLYVTLGIYQTQMNVTRNAIAILLCYIAFEFIEKKKPVKYVALVLIATAFHESSFLFLPMYWLVNHVRLTPKRISKILLGAAIFGAFFSVVRPYIYAVLPFQYKHYILGNTTKYESLIVGVFHFAIVAFTYLLLNKNERYSIVEKLPVGVWAFIADILFFCIGYDLSYATRIAALFGPYLIVLLPQMIAHGTKSKKQRAFAIVTLVVICGLQYVARISINNIGSTIPYAFFR